MTHPAELPPHNYYREAHVPWDDRRARAGHKHPAEKMLGVLHEERFDRNPSMKLPALEHHSSMQEFQIRLSHVWHRLPLLKVSPLVAQHMCMSHGTWSPWQIAVTGNATGCRNVGSALTRVASFYA